jgi:membrane protease YdiL (CAAX protease family)
MDNSTGKKPLLKIGWLRVLLFLVFYFFVLLLIAVPAVLLLTDIKASDMQANIAQSFSDMGSGSMWLMVAIEFISSVVSIFLFRKFVDRKSFASLGFTTKGHWHEMIAGFFLAPALIGIGLIFLYITKHLEWDYNAFNPQTFSIDAGTLMILAFSEELLFRGYVLSNLMESFNKWVALIISAVLFALFHLGNPGISTIPFMSIFLAGILFGINYIYTRNLWFSILLHFSWNFFQGPLYGFKVSGIHFSSLLQTELKGDISITGGDFGFEGSFVATALLLIAVLGFYLLYEKKFRVKSLESRTTK